MRVSTFLSLPAVVVECRKGTMQSMRAVFVKSTFSAILSLCFPWVKVQSSESYANDITQLQRKRVSNIHKFIHEETRKKANWFRGRAGERDD